MRLRNGKHNGVHTYNGGPVTSGNGGQRQPLCAPGNGGFEGRRLLLCALLLVAALFLLSGCRSRISDSPEVDRTVSMQGAPAAVEQYEERREELNLAEAVAPLRQKSQEEPAAQPSATTSDAGTASTAGNSGTGAGDGNGSGGSGTKGSGGGGTSATITVKLDPGGGSCETERMKVSYGKAYGSLPAAVQDGFVFRGWFTKAKGGSQVKSTTKVRTKKTHTLYAHWEKAEGAAFTVTFDPNGGRISEKYATRTLREGDVYGELPKVYNDGYVLDGWFTEPEGGTEIDAASVFPGGADQVLYAHWNYDPHYYWSYRLKNITEQMYACQVVPCYIEFEDHVTVSRCPLLSDCKAENVAMNRGDDIVVTDEWVEGKNPKVVIKCTGASAGGTLSKMAKRFPDRRVLVVPTQAASGSDNEQLYYKLYLGTLLYPDWFTDIDLGQAGAELGVSGQIYE